MRCPGAGSSTPSTQSSRYALHTPSESSRPMPTTGPGLSSSQATTTCGDCAKERRRASAERPLSKSSAARSALARTQSTPSSERSRRTRTAPAWHRSVVWPRWSMLSGVDIRPRRPSDIEPLLEMARLVKELDGYPPRGPLDRSTFLAPPQEVAAWVAEDGAMVVGHVALHAR